MSQQLNIMGPFGRSFLRGKRIISLPPQFHFIHFIACGICKTAYSVPIIVIREIKTKQEKEKHVNYHDSYY